MILQDQTNGRLTGRWLSAARTGWLIFFAVATLIFLAAIPARWDELTQPKPVTFANLRALGLAVTPYAVYSLLTEVLFTVVFLTVGLLIFVRRSDDRMALFTSLMLVAFGIGNQSLAPTIGALRQYPSGQLIWACAGYTAWVTFTQFPYLFPSGRYVPGWARLPALVWFLICIPYNFLINTVYFPLNWPLWWATPLMLFLYGSFIYSQVYRYRLVSTPIERQQTKWVLYAITIMFTTIILLFVISFALGSQAILYLLAGEPPAPADLLLMLVFQGLGRLAFLLLPIAFAVSIFRYRLWNIDILIRKTLLYTLLTVFLALLYFGSVTVMQGLVAAIGGRQSAVATVVSTLMIAALFTPLRRRLQAFIDRRFFRRKYDAEQALASFAEAARSQADLAALSNQLLSVASETMQPASIALWLSPQSPNKSEEI